MPCWGGTNRWTPSYVNKLLTSQAVVGDYIPQTTEGGQRIPVGEVRSGYYPPVITRDLWDYVQNLRSAKPHGRPSKRRVNNLFSGILWHGETGEKMSVLDKGKPQWTYLVSDPPLGKGTQRIHLNYLKFEHVFLEFVQELKWGSLVESVPPLNRDRQHQKVAQRREQLQNQLKRLVNRAEEMPQPPRELVERIRETRSELKTASAEIEAWESGIRARSMARSELSKNIEQFKKLVAAGEESSRAELREHIRQMVERIDVYPAGLDEIPHLKNTEGYPAYRIQFRSGAVKYLLTDERGELVAAVDEPATKRPNSRPPNLPPQS